MTDERFPNWEIDIENGTIWSTKYKRFLGCTATNGRILVNCYNKITPIYRIIYMVANQTDIPEGYDIHHIDGNPSNNSINNLELIERKQHISNHTKNNTYRRGSTLTDEQKQKISDSKKGKPVLSKRKKIVQYTMDGEFIKVWDYAELLKDDGFHPSLIHKCCRGERNHHKGFKFKFLDNAR